MLKRGQRALVVGVWLPAALLILAAQATVGCARSLQTGGAMALDRTPTSSTLQNDKTSATINVKSEPYNASGDGRRDDSSALRAALSAAPPGGALYIPTGTYLISARPLEIRKAVTIYGGGTLKHANRTTNFSLISILPGSSNVVLRDLRFDGNRDGQTNWSEFRHSVSAVDCSGVRIENCEFFNPIGDCIYMGCISGAQPPFMGVSDAKVINCRLQGDNRNRNGISIICGRRIEIVGNSIIGMAMQGMPGAVDCEPGFQRQFITDVNITGNTIERCRAGVILPNWVAIPKSNFSRFLIAGNTIKNTTGVTSDGGIKVLRGASATIVENTLIGITNGAAAVLEGDNLTFSSNVVRNCKWALAAHNSRGICISNNTFIAISGDLVLSIGECPASLITGNSVKGWLRGAFALDLRGDCSNSVIISNHFDGIVGKIASARISQTTTGLVAFANSFTNCSDIGFELQRRRKF